MDFKPIFFAYLVLCAIAFVEVLIKVRTFSLLKICLLLMIASLFVMNYFSFFPVSNRLQLVFVKSMRLVYVSSTMLAVVYLVNRSIPRWVTGFTVLAVVVCVGVRILYYDELAVNSYMHSAGEIFSVGPEFHSPIPFARYSILALAAVGAGLTFYYYRRFFLHMDRGDRYYRHLAGWLVSMVVPFFLLIIFGVLGIMEGFQRWMSPYLFLVFSTVIIFSILLRPKILNATLKVKS